MYESRLQPTSVGEHGTLCPVWRWRFSILVGNSHPPPATNGPLKGGPHLELGASTERRLPGPFDRLVEGLGRDDPVPSDQLPGIRKRAIDDGRPSARELNPRALRARLQT